MKTLSILFVLIIMLTSKSFGEPNKELSLDNNGVKFTSDNIKIDELNKIVTASGNVVIMNENRKIIADEIVYDQNLDKAIASGKVILTEQDGSVFESMGSCFPMFVILDEGFEHFRRENMALRKISL